MLNIIFFILFLLIWIMATGFIVYAYFYHERQRKILRYIAVKLATLTENATVKEPTHPTPAPEVKPEAPKKPVSKMTIDKNEPISKYESMSLPDEVDITFK